MNLLYISNNSNAVDGGLNWSVPASVKAQQNYDNVLWVDLTIGAFQEHWGKVEAYHNIKDFGDKISLDILPKPFNHPDCVIFESFYYFDHVRFSKELIKNNIPYIIIPRGSFAKDAFHNGGFFKFLKKKIAHWLIFNSYIKYAKGIQFLTDDEHKKSFMNIYSNVFVLSNGVDIPNVKKESFSEGIKCVFIGRQDIFHKGLDMLMESIKELHDKLKNVGFSLEIYGPRRYDYKKVSEMIEKLEIQDIVHNNERGISGKEKENVLLNSDVFFLTSRFEGHPMGLIEALSYGLPVFVTRGSNMYNEISEANAGWVCETSKDSIISGLVRMISEKDKFLQYSENAKNLATKYDWNSLAKEFHKNISSILNNTK